MSYILSERTHDNVALWWAAGSLTCIFFHSVARNRKIHACARDGPCNYEYQASNDICECHHARHSACIAATKAVVFISQREYEVWAFEFVPDRSWHRPNGIASKGSGCDGRTRSDWTTSSGDAGTCSVSVFMSLVLPSRNFRPYRGESMKVFQLYGIAYV